MRIRRIILKERVTAFIFPLEDLSKYINIERTILRSLIDLWRENGPSDIQISNPGEIWMIIHKNKVISALAIGNALFFQKEGEFIYNLTTHLRCRQRGHATRLLKAILKEKQLLYLEPTDNGELYKKLGFVTEGNLMKYVSNEM
jgi:ribosomal protein S18 acetylase RimI-like enzyme